MVHYPSPHSLALHPTLEYTGTVPPETLPVWIDAIQSELCLLNLARFVTQLLGKTS
jgi:hypothetical protein